MKLGVAGPLSEAIMCGLLWDVLDEAVVFAMVVMFWQHQHLMLQMPLAKM